MSCVITLDSFANTCWKTTLIIQRDVQLKTLQISWKFRRRLSIHCTILPQMFTLLWRHNEPDGVSNHQPHGCLFNRLFGHRSKKTSKLRVTGLCVGNSPGPVNSPHKRPVTRKMFPFDDVIMIMQCASYFWLSIYFCFTWCSGTSVCESVNY